MVVLVAVAVAIYSHFPNRAVVDDHSHRFESGVLLDLFPLPSSTSPEVPYRAGVLFAYPLFVIFLFLFSQDLLGNFHPFTSLNLGVY